MNIPIHLRAHYVAGGALMVVCIISFGCTSSLPTLSRALTAIPVAMQVTNTPEAAETIAIRTIEAALTPIPTDEPEALNAATMTSAANATIIATMLTDEPATATPDLTATAANVATDAAAIVATLTALAPTITPTPTPDQGAMATATAAKMATAIAATLTAITPTPDQAATEAANVAKMQTAIAATLTAQPTFTPDWAATQTMQAHLVETMVAATLTAQPTPVPPPTNTPLPPPPTNTPVPAPPNPPPAPSGFFRGHVTPVCTGERNMTWFEGTVYINNQPANGYQVVFKSYLVPGDEPVTAPAVSGPHDGYTTWPNGYYSHIVNDYFSKKHLEIWIINNARQAISDRVHWDTDGPDGPCNKAVIDFYQ